MQIIILYVLYVYYIIYYYYCILGWLETRLAQITLHYLIYIYIYMYSERERERERERSTFTYSYHIIDIYRHLHIARGPSPPGARSHPTSTAQRRLSPTMLYHNIEYYIVPFVHTILC